MTSDTGESGAERECSDCGHTKSAHRYESGFYDVRGHYAECSVVGCPCRRLR